MEQDAPTIVDKLDAATDAVTFHIEGRYIHSNSVDFPTLYKLSDSAMWLRDSLKAVQLYTLDSAAPADPSNKAHKLCTLRHPDSSSSSSSGPPDSEYYAESVSETGPCSVSLTTFRPSTLSLHRGHRVHRLAKALDGGVEQGELLFTAVPMQEKDVCCEWTNDSGLVAYETDDSGLTKLTLMADLSRDMQRALVVSWILRLWWDNVKHPGKFSDDGT